MSAFGFKKKLSKSADMINKQIFFQKLVSKNAELYGHFRAAGKKVIKNHAKKVSTKK